MVPLRRRRMAESDLETCASGWPSSLAHARRCMRDPVPTMTGSGRSGFPCCATACDHMLDVVIVDDEAAGRRTLRECCAGEADLRIVGEFADNGAALEAIRANPP